MDTLGDPITLEHIQAHTRRTNPRATGKMLSILGRKRKFVDELNTEVGQQLFKKVTTRLEELFEKVADDTAEPEEKMEFKVTRRLLGDWAKEMGEYVKAKKRLQGKE